LGVSAGRLAVLLAAVLVGACQSPDADLSEPPSESSEVGPRTYSICPAGGDPIDPVTTDEAIDILNQRLGFLGVTNATIARGACLDVTVPATATDPAIAPAVQGTGTIALVAVDSGFIPGVRVGAAAPPDLEQIADGSDVTGAGAQTGASPGTTDLTVELRGAAAANLGARAAADPGGVVVLVVDGVVVGIRANTPITGERISFAIPDSVRPPARAIEAMLASGPLPEAWAQPENPQG
jgi:hypothetical protein